MLGASNLRQQRRLWTVLERPDMINQTNEQRDAARAAEESVLAEIMLTRTAADWEDYLQARHVPAARVRTMGEARIDTPPPALGNHNDVILAELGYRATDIAQLRTTKVI